MAVKSADLESVLVGCDQIFRRLLQQGKARLSSTANESSDSARLELCFLVSTEGAATDSEGEGSTLLQRIAARMDRILAESDGSSVSPDCTLTLTTRCAMTVDCHPRSGRTSCCTSPRLCVHRGPLLPRVRRRRRPSWFCRTVPRCRRILRRRSCAMRGTPYPRTPCRSGAR